MGWEGLRMKWILFRTLPANDSDLESEQDSYEDRNWPYISTVNVVTRFYCVRIVHAHPMHHQEIFCDTDNATKSYVE